MTAGALARAEGRPAHHVPPHIDPLTKLAGVIGWPLDHTLSPAIHNAAYAAMGLNWVYIPMPLRSGGDLMRVASAIRVLPFVGFNVTMPYKRLMLNICDEVATAARLAGAVNAVHVDDGRLIGYNTDGRGFVESLRQDADFDVKGKRAVVIGTGGAAGAAFVGLLLERAGHVTIAGRRLDAAEVMIDNVVSSLRQTVAVAVELGPKAREAVEAADLVINATPLGMAPSDELPVPPEWIQPGQVVADMVYRPAVTPFMDAAAARGARTLGGLGMLIDQGAIAIEIWNQGSQAVAPRDVMRAAATEALGAAVAAAPRGAVT